MHVLVQTLDATWSPFVLVAGLLLIGHVAAEEGLFRLAGWWCARVPGGAVPLFLVTMVAVALVTAVLNLDTSVVFMTPVALHAARSKHADETAFLYGTIFVSNSASLLLLGSNLTNLLIFSSRNVLGISFARHMVLAWIVSLVGTILVVLVWRRRALSQPVEPSIGERGTFVWGPGVVGATFAVVAILVMSKPAPWIFAAGVAAELYGLLVTKRGTLREAVAVTSPATLALLFVVATAVGWLARASTFSEHLLRHANVVVTIASATVVTLIINNLPAASLFAAHRVAHPYALLVGLDLGPNVVVTGALSSLLWLRLARKNASHPSLATFSKVGVLVAVITIVGAAGVV